MIKRLSPRQLEVAKLVFDGLINKEIAQNLGTSERTVHNQVTTICRKLGTQSSRGIAKKLFQYKYLSVSDYREN
jgi:two-component system response regulator FixJ